MPDAISNIGVTCWKNEKASGCRAQASITSCRLLTSCLEASAAHRSIGTGAHGWGRQGCRYNSMGVAMPSVVGTHWSLADTAGGD